MHLVVHHGLEHFVTVISLHSSHASHCSTQKAGTGPKSKSTLSTATEQSAATHSRTKSAKIRRPVIVPSPVISQPCVGAIVVVFAPVWPVSTAGVGTKVVLWSNESPTSYTATSVRTVVISRRSSEPATAHSGICAIIIPGRSSKPATSYPRSRRASGSGTIVCSSIIGSRNTEKSMKSDFRIDMPHLPAANRFVFLFRITWLWIGLLFLATPPKAGYENNNQSLVSKKTRIDDLHWAKRARWTSSSAPATGTSSGLCTVDDHGQD